MNNWKEAIIDELVLCHIYNSTHDDDPRKAIMDLIDWHVDVALDPDVSEDAQVLIYIGASVENEACVNLIEAQGSSLANGAMLVEAIKARMPHEY